MARAASQTRPQKRQITRDLLFGTAFDRPQVLELDVGSLEANPDQPRKRFDEEALRELAESIRKHGLIQPITVKQLDDSDRYIVVAGERRWRAHQLIERDTIFAIRTEGSPDEIALIENLQRQDLHPLEEAEALSKMMKRHGYTQEQLSKVIGKGRTTITELLSLNDLPDEVKEDCLTSDIPSKSLLIEIARVPDHANQLALWSKVKDGQFTVKQARKAKREPARPAQTTVQEAQLAGRTLLKRLSRITELDESGREALRELRGQLDQVLGQLLAD